MNPKYYSLPLLFSIALFTGRNVLGQGEFLAKNIAHRYDPKAEIDLNYEVVSKDDRVLLFLQLTIRHNRTKLSDLTTTYALLNKLSGQLTFSSDTIDMSKYWINNVANQHLFNIEMKNPNRKKTLVLRIHNRATDKEFYFDITIDPDANVLNSGILITYPDRNFPLFRPFVRTDEKFKIANYKSSDSVHYVYRYSNDFPVASPPFSTSAGTVSKELTIDKAFSIKVGDDLSFENEGLFLIQSDTSGINGYSVRNEDKFFPRLGTYNDLIDALLYFSTDSEMEMLITSNDKKTAFEKYWLDVTGSGTRASQVIKEYYQSVRRANDFFTSYKEGWKTDQGMIYIIFGIPDFVTRDDKKEEWIYERTVQLPRISFEFQKIESIFTPNHYVLVRKKSYQQIWYKAIDLWRKGQKDN